MTNSKKDIMKKFKEEADDFLFDDIDFHSSLKEKVRSEISKPSMKSGLFSWMKEGFKNRKFSIATAVALASIMFLSILMLPNGTDVSQPLSKDQNNEEFTPFLGEDDPTVLPGEDQAILKTKELETADEAKQWFGNEVLLPAYIPENFSLEKITVTSMYEEAKQLAFTYTFEKLSYMVIVEKNTLQMKPNGFKEINLQDTIGYLKTEEGNQVITELHWFQDDFHYMINGLISSDEAIQIAKSFK